jgi:hypothetical protein
VVSVRDSSGGRSFVGGATVKLSGPVVLETQTDEKGNYAFPHVAPEPIGSRFFFQVCKPPRRLPSNTTKLFWRNCN